MVVQEERQRNIGSGSSLPDTVSMVFGTSSSANSLAYVGNSGTSKAPSGSYGNSKTRRNKVVCTHCSFNGHTKKNCYKLIGYPPGWKSRPKNQGSYSAANQTKFTDANVT